MIEIYIYPNFLERRKFRKLSLGFIITTPRKTPKNQQFWSKIKKIAPNIESACNQLTTGHGTFYEDLLKKWQIFGKFTLYCTFLYTLGDFNFNYQLALPCLLIRNDSYSFYGLPPYIYHRLQSYCYLFIL